MPLEVADVVAAQAKVGGFGGLAIFAPPRLRLLTRSATPPWDRLWPHGVREYSSQNGDRNECDGHAQESQRVRGLRQTASLP